MRMARWIWKKSCAAVLCGALVCAMLPSTGFAESADTSYFCDENGVRYGIPQEMVVVEDETTSWNGEGGEAWYVVNEDAEISERVEVSGAVNLVLCDGVTLTAEKGIHVTGENSLTIYGQEAGDGKIEATAIKDQAAIGGNIDEPGGILTINGGTIDANGGVNAAGIGGGFGGKGTAGNITINSGNVYAKGGIQAAGIGGGIYASGVGDGEKIVINGGEVEAIGGSNAAGIGGGMSGVGGDIEINGGSITAKGINGGAGIGSGFGSKGDENRIYIIGGKVYAIGSSLDGTGSAGIGGGHLGAGGSITISGAEVHATGGEGAPAGDGIGNGGGYKGADADVVITDETGCPLIYANSLMGNTEDWCGIIFLRTNGKVYGESVSLQTNLTIDKGQTLEIPKGTTLMVPDDVTLTNDGAIVGEGTLLGDVQGNPASESIDDGKISVTLAVEPAASGTVSGDGRVTSGQEITVEATPNAGYHFVGWQSEAGTVSTKQSHSFIAENDVYLTAVFSAHVFSEERLFDDEYHWKECACGAEAEKEAHRFTNKQSNRCAVAATCTESARYYVQCDACAVVSETQTVAVGTPLGHALAYHERVAPTYSAEGREAHYACAVCGALFLDAAAEQPVSEETLVIPKLERPQNPPTTPSEPEEPPALEIAETAHGAVVVSTAHPDYGEVVTIVPQPDSGYVVETVTVADADGEALAVTALEDGSYQFIQPRGTVEIIVTFVALSEEPVVLPFVDVAAEDWYGDAVATVYARGLMTGTAEDTFAPELAATRGMVVSILHRLAGSPTVSAEVFADVAADDWYGQAVAWAANEGIASGTSAETFSPNAAVTREQLAALLCNFAAQQGVDTTACSDLSNFDDAAAVSDWAQDAVSWAHAEGLLAGTSATTLSPQGEATRAQLAAMLVRFSDYLENAA
ncbi:MAG: S-layer homology domain-containing protein [Peptococcaceae bacterium]|nr:S-layer homology domain-containing protein [Peptococcaceae bacterium]